MTTRLMLETLRQADDGHVECHVATPDGKVLKGVIEQSFFEEFMTAQPPVAPAMRDAQVAKRVDEARHQRIVRDNLTYLEKEFDKQWRMGGRVFVLR